MVNQELATGFKLPIPGKYTKELSNSRLFVYDHFILIESTPNITPKVRNEAMQIANQFEQKFNDIFQTS